MFSIVLFLHVFPLLCCSRSVHLPHCSSLSLPLCVRFFGFVSLCHIHTYTYIYTHTYTYIYTDIHIHIHTYTQTHRHTHIHIHTDTQTHIHTYARPSFGGFLFSVLFLEGYVSVYSFVSSPTLSSPRCTSLRCHRICLFSSQVLRHVSCTPYVLSTVLYLPRLASSSGCPVHVCVFSVSALCRARIRYSWLSLFFLGFVRLCLFSLKLGAP